MQLTCSTIVVTGASDGIGREIALNLASKGVHVVLLARDEQKLQSVQAEIVAKQGGAEYVVCDLSQADQVRSTAAEIVQRFPGVVGLINNAGVWQKVGQLDEISDDVIEAVLQTNLHGLILLTKHLLPTLRQATEAVIVNVSSRSGHSAQSGQSVYTASKWGVRGFTEVLHTDLAETSVRVAGIYQGGTNTNMFHKAGETWPAEKLQSFIPANELAEVVAFVASRPKQVWLTEVRIENK
jgi:NADP-dependent 3-hydroxy acid dehydrogenase YdfG